MKFESLPFVSVAGTGGIIDTWNVAPSGVYAEDCATGRKHFQMLQMVMNVTANPLLLVRVIEGQAKKYGSWTGVEAGFHAAMADELTVN